MKHKEALAVVILFSPIIITVCVLIVLTLFPECPF